MAQSLLPYEGYEALGRRGLSAFVSGTNGARCRLFQNNYFPTKASSWVDFEEAAFTGYAPQSPGVPTDEGLTPLNIQIFRFAPIVFTMFALPMATAYGYWIDWINPIGSIRQVLWVKRFDNPFLFTGPGSSLAVVLTPGFRQGV
jgi:hypothetical protein